MDALKLNESEQKFFEELFQTLDYSKTAKLQKVLVGELFATSGLPTDTLLTIAELCGASRLGYFGRSQFYIALKLIAVAQQQLPLSLESFAGNLSLPIFNLTALNLKLANPEFTNIHIAPESQVIPQMSGGVLPPPPTKKHVRNMSGTIHQHSVQISAHAVQSHPAQSNPSHQIVNLTVSAGMLPTPLSATQTNAQVVQKIAPHTGPHILNKAGQSALHNPSVSSASNKGWASFSVKHTEDDETNATNTGSSPQSEAVPGYSSQMQSNWVASNVNKVPFNPETCSLSSADYATSEAESTDDVWTINDEQREYYINQFLTMQPDLTSAIKGSVAKEFFEKSKLPTKELSKIWKLSDVNRDGALTLQEFCTAMHLVVLRRNDIELPSILPPSLMPYTPASSEPFSSDLGEEQINRSPSPMPPAVTQHPTSWVPLNSDSSAQKWSADQVQQWQDQTNAGALWNSQSWQQPGSDVAAQWKMSESSSPIQPQWTGSSVVSGLSSPTIKPVNFDSALTSSIEEIVHPVAIRMSPTVQNGIIEHALERPRVDSEPGLLYEAPTHNILVRQRSNTENAIGQIPDQPKSHTLPPRPRPVPKRAVSSPVSSEAKNSHQAVQNYQSLPASHVPVVPPRNSRTFSATDQELALLDPFVADHTFIISQGADFADFSGFVNLSIKEPFPPTVEEVSTAAGDVPRVDMQPVMMPTVAPNVLQTVHKYSIRDKKEIQNSIKEQKLRNAALVTVNSELHQELQEVMEQRISLEIQLEHLKPC